MNYKLQNPFLLPEAYKPMPVHLTGFLTKDKIDFFYVFNWQCSGYARDTDGQLKQTFKGYLTGFSAN